MIQENISLKAYNSFNIEAKARYFFSYKNPEDIKKLHKAEFYNINLPFFILGGGSNVLFAEDFDGLVIHPVNKEIHVLKIDKKHVWVEVGAGMEWDKWVEYAVSNNWGGLENLSLIPGSVGAAPVQNIGAYGVEAKDTIHEVNCVDIQDVSTHVVSNEECKFGYRDSIFKHAFKNRYIVHSVTFKLSLNHEYKLHYGSVKEEVGKLGGNSIQNIRKAIIKIRESKLPDHTILGNAGSFFKNPVLPNEIAKNLLVKFPDMVNYPTDNFMTKLAAGWLIEKSGLKGYRLPNKRAGVHNEQALVLVNYGDAKAADILELAKYIQNRVFERFDVCLEPEVLFI
jgi:UDP-N-acetylmuramate dehydrogenase